MATDMYLRQAAKNLARAESERLSEVQTMRAELLKFEQDVKRELDEIRTELRDNEQDAVDANKSDYERAASAREVKKLNDRRSQLESDLSQKKIETDKRISELEDEAQEFKQTADDLTARA